MIRIEPTEPATKPSRRHDLDALRGFAMLLGIGLHAALSFVPAPWPVQDTRQGEVFGLFLAMIHGFRMPMFFLLSGFFTMMLYRRRGLASTLGQRAARILVPCLLGLVTVVPLMRLASGWAGARASASATPAEDSLVAAIRRGDRPAMRRFLEDRQAVNLPDPGLGITPLAWASMKGDVESVTILIDGGADLNKPNRDGSTALHGAAFLGRHDVAEILIRRGADPKVRNRGGEYALRATYADWGITDGIARFLGFPPPERPKLEAGRGRVRAILAAITPADDRPATAAPSGPSGWPLAYREFLDSERFVVHLFGSPYHLFNTNVFDHLWFLWSLCWMVAIFGLIAALAARFQVGTDAAIRPRPGLMFALIPLTLVPQWFMGARGFQFGPDTATGLIPPPHILAYYLAFFGFGALAYDAQGAVPGRRWWAWLGVGLIVGFPLGLVTQGHRAVGSVVQVLYAWVVSFGFMGLFRARLARERPAIRYLSDSSYWLYVAHLPLVIVLQAIVRPWPLPAAVKFAFVCLASTALLLVSYELFVRKTPIGRLLNGPRPAPGRPTPRRSAGPRSRHRQADKTRRSTHKGLGFGLGPGSSSRPRPHTAAVDPPHVGVVQPRDDLGLGQEAGPADDAHAASSQLPNRASWIDAPAAAAPWTSRKNSCRVRARMRNSPRCIATPRGPAMTEREIFVAALHQRGSEGRRTFLDGACGADLDLRGRVEALLAEHDGLGSFLESPAIVPPETADLGPHADPTVVALKPPSPPTGEAVGGSMIGPYKLLEVIGEGGMGTVYMAEQTEPVRRRVALKVIKAGHGLAARCSPGSRPSGRPWP